MKLTKQQQEAYDTISQAVKAVQTAISEKAECLQLTTVLLDGLSLELDEVMYDINIELNT